MKATIREVARVTKSVIFRFTKNESDVTCWL